MKVTVITVSDRASRGEYEDLSGPEVERGIREAIPVAEVVRVVVSDDPAGILHALEGSAGADFIITTGGTGLSPRDSTPEVTRGFCDRELPGVSEAIRAESLKETPMAMLSRAFAGMRGACVVVNLPGSVKAARTGVRVLVPVMEHAARMARGEGH